MARKAKEAVAADALDPVQVMLDRGQLGPAVAALLPALERRGGAGDQACALAARLLRLSPVTDSALPRPPDALAAALDRLLRLVDRQEEQIRALHAILEEEL